MKADAAEAGTAPAAPPERIVLCGLVLRRWAEEDVGAMVAAATESHEHLYPWMPWAAQPPSPTRQREFARASLEHWRRGEAYNYGIFAPDGTAVLGGIGLHRRIGPDGLEIGYWVHVHHTRQGIAGTAAAVLTATAFALPGIERVEIHCDQANAASAAVPRRLGYRLDRTRPRPKDAPATKGVEMIWVMPHADFAGSEAARRAHAAVGSAGAR